MSGERIEGRMPGRQGRPWIDEVRGELEHVCVRATECDARISLALGGPETRVAERSARKLVALAPFRESGYCLLMEALEREGNVAEAIRVYERLRDVLRDELGTTPSLGVRQIHDRLLAHR